jgi:molybdenum cofactor cytidylyltransferase
MTLRPRHAALVLAAGGSARLGTPKQLLRIRGETLVHRALRLADSTAPSSTFVVLGPVRDRIVTQLRDLSHEVVFNPEWESGLSSSLRAAAPLLAPHEAVLILGCDQPGLETSHLRTLLEGAAGATTHCAAALKAGLPGIPAVVPGEWFSGRDLETGDIGFRSRLRGLPSSAIFTLDAPELHLDIDTPDDLRQARAAGLLDDP